MSEGYKVETLDYSIQLIISSSGICWKTTWIDFNKTTGSSIDFHFTLIHQVSCKSNHPWLHFFTSSWMSRRIYQTIKVKVVYLPEFSLLLSLKLTVRAYVRLGYKALSPTAWHSGINSLSEGLSDKTLMGRTNGAVNLSKCLNAPSKVLNEPLPSVIN